MADSQLEYFCMWLNYGEAGCSLMQSTLDRMAGQGWELVSVIRDTLGARINWRDELIFKRTVS